MRFDQSERNKGSVAKSCQKLCYLESLPYHNSFQTSIVKKTLQNIIQVNTMLYLLHQTQSVKEILLNSPPTSVNWLLVSIASNVIHVT